MSHRIIQILTILKLSIIKITLLINLSQMSKNSQQFMSTTRHNQKPLASTLDYDYLKDAKRLYFRFINNKFVVNSELKIYKKGNLSLKLFKKSKFKHENKYHISCCLFIYSFILVKVFKYLSKKTPAMYPPNAGPIINTQHLLNISYFWS